jgi:hypothetical protein
METKQIQGHIHKTIRKTAYAIIIARASDGVEWEYRRPFGSPNESLAFVESFCTCDCQFVPCDGDCGLDVEVEVEWDDDGSYEVVGMKPQRWQDARH